MFRFLAAVALLFLAACAVDPTSLNADNETIAKARYVSSEPPSITLYTVINKKSGSGAHSAMLVNGSESVLFDPAGSFRLANMPEKGDVLYGASPRWMAAYVDYHARDTHFMRQQKLFLPPAVAERILVDVKTNGAVQKAHCANSISRMLSQVPGFQQISTTYFPKRLESAFAENPNIIASVIYDETADKSHGVNFIAPKD